MSILENYNLKKFLKDCIRLYKDIQNEQFDDLFEDFQKDNKDLLKSFSDTIQEFTGHSYTFNPLNGKVSAISKKENAYQICTSFFKEMDDMGDANVLMVMRKPSKMFTKLFEKNYEIFGIYIIDHKIAVIYFDKNKKLDFYIEDNTVEHIVIQSVTVDIEALR